jgi:hypothetical protein
MKYLKTVTLSGLVMAACVFGTRAMAQDQPPAHFVVQTTSKFDLPEGTDRAEVQKTYQEYYDKVISKSQLVKHYAMYIHAWGSLGASYVTSMEFDTWADVDKFSDEFDALEKAAWPDETARKAFMKKLESYRDPYHRDEIYTVMPTMRK